MSSQLDPEKPIKPQPFEYVDFWPVSTESDVQYRVRYRKDYSTSFLMRVRALLYAFVEDRIKEMRTKDIPQIIADTKANIETIKQLQKAASNDPEREVYAKDLIEEAKYLSRLETHKEVLITQDQVLQWIYTHGSKNGDFQRMQAKFLIESVDATPAVEEIWDKDDMPPSIFQKAVIFFDKASFEMGLSQ